MGCCASTSRKAPISAHTAPRRLQPWRPPSTPDRERRLPGKHQPRRLNSYFGQPTNIMLRRPLESAQDTTLEFGGRCRQTSVRPSMGSVGDAYDNAMCESFFATLECELLDRIRFKNPVEARLAVFDFIEGWYNPPRRHSALAYFSPINYERRQLAN